MAASDSPDVPTDENAALPADNARGALLMPPGVRSKYFTWGRIDRGSCTLFYAKLELYSDGLADWGSAVATDSSGDVWLVQGIRLMNELRTELFVIPQFNGPRMDVEDMNYYFNRYRDIDPLYFPPQLFDSIAHAEIIRCSC